MAKIIPIYFTFDNNYVEPAAVAFYSLLQKAKSGIFYEMYVLHSDITNEKQELLQNIVKKFKNANLSFIDTHGFLQEEWKNGNFAGFNNTTIFTTDTIIKCFGAKFFPQYDKIIYSDVDVIFADNISEIYDINIEDKYMAAVKNINLKYKKSELAHLKPEHFKMLEDTYFAGGIWVLNLKKIREDNLEKRFIEIIQDNTIVKHWPDQDIMNIACENKVAYIPLNYISYPDLLDLLSDKNFVSHYTKEELFDSIFNPKIIHFAAFKPWNNDTQFANLWWAYFYYLGLKKTSIFKDVKTIELNKRKKYKKLFNILTVITVILVVSNIITLLLLIFLH